MGCQSHHIARDCPLRLAHISSISTATGPASEARQPTTEHTGIMPEKTEELASLIHKGRAAAFALELEELAEQGEPPSIEGATFKGRNINKFHFRDVDMTNVAFEQCTIADCVFEGCKLDGTYLDGSTLFECTFKGCSGDGFAIDTCTIGQSRFEALELDAAEWTDTQLNDCHLEDLTLTEPLLERLTLRDSVIAGLAVAQGELVHVTLRNSSGLETFEVEDATSRSCYVVGGDEDAPTPEGFSRKSGRRRTF